MKKIDSVLNKALYWLIASLMFAMAVLIFAQVLARYAFGNSLTWSEEVGRYIFVWMSFLGMATAIREKAHVALDILLQHLTGVSKRAVVLFNGLRLLFLSGALTASGFFLVQYGMLQNSSAVRLPMHFVYAVIPFSGVLMFYYAFREMAETWKNAGGGKV